MTIECTKLLGKFSNLNPCTFSYFKKMEMYALVANLSFATILCATKCHLQLQMVAYATIFQIWMDFGFPFN
jgi:hypothetical protein